MIIKLNTKKNKFQRGFLLTEVLVTMFLIVITMVGILPILFGGIKSSNVSKIRTALVNTAQKEIENFNQKKFSILLGEIKNKIPIPEDFKDFMKGIYVFHEDPNIIYINTVNGKISNAMETGSSQVVVRNNYSFLGDEKIITDDVIQLSVEVQIVGSTSKPVTITSIMNRDKL